MSKEDERHRIKSRIGGNSIKFLSSISPHGMPPSILPSDKRLLEFFLGLAFAQLLIRNSIEVSTLTLNEDDSHGGADIIATISRKVKRIQLTKLSVNDPERRKNIAKLRAEGIIDLVLEKTSIERPINVILVPGRSQKRKIPPLNDIKKEKIAKCISAAIKMSREGLIADNIKFTASIKEKEIKDYISGIIIIPVKENQTSLFPGKQNLHISYDIDNIYFTKQDVIDSISKIKKTKEGGDSDTLLIWAEEFEILNQTQEIAQLIAISFKDTDYMDVYFLTFSSRVDIFTDTLKLYKLK